MLPEVPVSVSGWLGDCSGMVSGTAPERSRLARGLSWSSSVLVSLSWLTRGGRRLGPLTTSSTSESESRERSREPDEPREFPGKKTVQVLFKIGLLAQVLNGNGMENHFYLVVYLYGLDDTCSFTVIVFSYPL